MVSSTTRWASSSASSCSSDDSWEPLQDFKSGGLRAQMFAEPLSGEDQDERSVARRVLADLETLCLDSEDDSDASGDEFDSDSESESETSSCDRRGKRIAGGMTLEELTVAVNAAIEYHRPAKRGAVDPSVRQSRPEADEELVGRSRVRHQRSRSRRRESEESVESAQTEGSMLSMFQKMLEKKERDFYSLKASSIDIESVEELPKQSVESCNITADQQQQTLTCVRDQATETENDAPRSLFDASFTVAEFDSPPHSPPLSIYDELVLTPQALLEPVVVGPTLADLAISCGRIGRSHSSSASESSWSASSSSSRSAVANESFQSSRSSSSSKRSVSSSSRSRSTNRRENSISPIGRSSTRTSLETRNPKIHPSIQQKPKDHQLASVGENESEDPPQVSRSPTLVMWELDLSNFAF